MTLYLSLLGMLLAASPGTRGLGKDLLAVLEELHPRGQPRTTIARVAFRKTASGWAALPDGFEQNHPLRFDPEALPGQEELLRPLLPVFGRWSVCLEGKAIGALDTTLPPRWAGPALRGAHLLAEGSRPGWAGTRSLRHAGWPEEPVHRPLVLNGEARCGDPQGWAEAALPGPLAREIGQALGAAAGTSAICEGREGPGTCPLEVARWKVVRSYASGGRRWLLEARAQKRGGGSQLFLFTLDAAGARLLGADMAVLDAGDYDGDGQAELVARFHRENHDGYALFFGPGFEKSVSFGWRYR